MFEFISKYNFWDREIPTLGFERNSYLLKIQKFISNRLVKVLTGQRRVGKSYLLRQIINHLITIGVNRKNIFYFNKEYLEFDWVKSWKDLEKLINIYRENINPEGKIYFFFDEIQQVDQWEKLVNSYSQDFTSEYEIFITGSNSDMLSGELATFLSGRYVQFEIFPFSFDEYNGYHKLDKTRENYIKYLQDGGLPELYYLPDFESKNHYVTSLRDTVLLRDIIDRYKIKDSVLLDDLFKFITNNTSNLISIPNIVNFLKSSKRKTNYETLSLYIQYLINAYLVHECERFDIKGKELLGGSRKYYLNDLSFYNYLYPGYRHGSGFILENQVYLHFKNQGYTVYSGNIRGKEIDFVLQKAEQIKYVQVSYALQDENTLNRELSGLKNIKDNYDKWIISLDDFALKNHEGIVHKLAWEL